MQHHRGTSVTTVHPTRRAGIVALVAAAVALLVGACSSSSSGGGATGTLQVATAQPPTSLDPCAGTGGADLPFLNPIFAPLIFSVPSTGKLEPGLAQSWKFSGPQNLTFTITLKSGRTFQDGTKVDAAAVASSINRCLGLKVQSIPTVKSVTASGSDKVVFSLSGPTSGLPGLLASRIGMITSPSAVKKYGKNFANHPVGAGPYAFVSYVPGSAVTLKKFDGYKAAGEPAAGAGGMHIQIIEDQTALAGALTSGSADYGFALDPSIVSTLKKSGIHIHINTKSLAFTNLAFNEALPPMNNVKVRLAIEYAIDRKTLASAASDGVHTTAAWAPYPPGNPYYDPAMENAWPYNPQKAKQLLADAGYPNGITLTGVAIAAPPFQNDGIILEQPLAKAGIHIHFKNEEPTQAIDSFSTKKAAQVFSIGFDATPTPYATYYGIFSKDSFFNAGHVETKGMEPLIGEMNSTYSDADVLKVIKKANQVVKAQAPIAPLYYNPFPEAYTAKIKGADQASSLIGEPDLNFLRLS